MRADNTTTTYAQMGMAALLPGMQYMLDRMQAELDQMREHLATLQQGGDPSHQKNPKRVAGGRNGWPSDPEERSREMQRRRQVARSKKIAADRKRAWAKKTPAEKQAWVEAVQAGKAKKQAELKAA